MDTSNSKNTLAYGSYVALVTPFNADFSVNFDKFAELVDWHVAGGTNGIVACGTTGEASTLKDREQLDVIEHIVKLADNRIPVIAGTGSNDTPHSLYLSLEAEKRNANGLLLITPYYNKTNDEGLYRHFMTVADKVRLPIILYNVPGRTGMNIPIQVLQRLAVHENIVAVKEASGNLDYVLKIASTCPELAIFSGNDSQVLPILSLGGVGVISVAANIFPEAFARMCAHYREGRISEATRLQIKYAKIIEALFIEVNPIPVKEAMNYLKWDVGTLRPPLYAMSDHAREKLLEELKKYF